MDFGENMKRIRKSRKLSQHALGDILGIRQQSVAQYEKSQNAPKFETVQKIANALEVPVSILYGDNVIPPESFLSMVNQVMDAKNEPVSAEDQKKAKFNIRIPEDLKYNLVAAMDKITDPRDSDLIRIQLLNCYDNRLNDNGKAEALKRVEELAEIKKYSQVPDSDEPLTAAHDKLED